VRVALTIDERALLSRLRLLLMRDTLGHGGHLGFRTLDRYYNGDQVLAQLGLAVPAELQQFVTIVGWPGTYTDAIGERCTLEGFRLGGQPEADSDLWRVWQANDLDSEFQLGQTDSLVFGRSYLCVGAGEEDQTPLVTVESPLEMVHEDNPRTRRVRDAARFYLDDAGDRRSTLYLADETVHAVMGPSGWEEATDPGFERDEHGMGAPPVEPLVNASRLHRRKGRSQMLRIIGLTDSAARALTLAQVATEVMGIPQRTAAGLTQADFKDPATGEVLTQWEAYFGAIWATTNKDAKFNQFSSADLSNFSGIVNHYGAQVSGLTGLPMRYLGQSTTNPPSAEGIRADEARLVLTCEQKNLSWGESAERTMRRVRRFQGKAQDDAEQGMETLWRDPATPTRAQAADAAVKLYQAGLIPKRQAREDLGYSSVQIKSMELWDTEEAADPVTERLANRLLSDANASAGQ
jgi:hypothetical protein